MLDLADDATHGGPPEPRLGYRVDTVQRDDASEMEPLSLEEWLDGLDCCGMYSALVNQVRLSFQ
jgi:hypothetical protein